MGCGQKAVADDIEDLSYLIKSSKTTKFQKAKLYSVEASALEKAYFSLGYSGPLADAYVELQLQLIELDRQKTNLVDEFETLKKSPYMKDFTKKGL